MQDVDGIRKTLKYSIQRQRKPDRDFIEKKKQLSSLSTSSIHKRTPLECIFKERLNTLFTIDLHNVEVHGTRQSHGNIHLENYLQIAQW